MISIKKNCFYLFLFFSFFSFSQNADKLPTIYQFKVTDINGDTFDFKRYKGYKIMIVNTASKCGLTPQYEALQALYDQYHYTKKFIVVGFPANNFLSQEPGTDEEIKDFCKENYGVTFPMMSKISVKEFSKISNQ